MSNRKWMGCITNVSGRMCRTITLASLTAMCATAAIAQMSSGNMGSMDKMDKPTPGMKKGGTTGHMTMDKAFVRKALQGGMAEVELGKLALTKTKNADIKAFAQKMVDDHTKMGDDMKVVATKLNVPVPTRLSNKDNAIKMKLSSLNGAAFDKSYLKDMVMDHQADEKDFMMESKMATIPEVKEAATKGEQTVSMHLQMVKDLAAKNGVKGE